MTAPLPLVLIPGLYGSPRLFARQIPALWRRGPVTVANHGGHDDLERIAATILAQAPERFALAGFSMGGMVAMAMQRQAPERIARLALLDTSARPDDETTTGWRRAAIDGIRAGRLEEGLDASLPLLVHPGRAADPELRELLRAMFLDTGEDAAVRQQEALIGRADARPGLAGVAVPTLVLVGADDALTPPALAQEIAAAIPHAHLVTIPAAGHMTPLERPDALTRELERWLAAA